MERTTRPPARWPGQPAPCLRSGTAPGPACCTACWSASPSPTPDWPEESCDRSPPSHDDPTTSPAPLTLSPGRRLRHLEIRPGLYRDSVRLMQISAALA